MPVSEMHPPAYRVRKSRYRRSFRPNTAETSSRNSHDGRGNSFASVLRHSAAGREMDCRCGQRWHVRLLYEPPSFNASLLQQTNSTVSLLRFRYSRLQRGIRNGARAERPNFKLARRAAPVAGGVGNRKAQNAESQNRKIPEAQNRIRGGRGQRIRVQSTRVTRDRIAEE